MAEEETIIGGLYYDVVIFQFRVRVGVYNWTDQDQGVLTMEVADIHRFSSDLETGLVGDIALVRLKTPIPLAKYYRTLCVPRNDSKLAMLY